MATTPRTEINAVRGDDENYDITLEDSAGVATDITSATIALTVKKEPTDVTALLSNAGAIVDAVNGQFRVSISGAEWDNLPAGKYHYDVQVTFVSGDIFTALLGKLIVDQDITI